MVDLGSGWRVGLMAVLVLLFVSGVVGSEGGFLVMLIAE